MPPKKKPATSPAPVVLQADTQGVAAARLRSFIERIELIETDIADMNADKSEIYKEAKAGGFDTKVMRLILRDRKMEEPDRKERDELFELYWNAVEHRAAPPVLSVVPAAPAPTAATGEPETAFLDQ